LDAVDSLTRSAQRYEKAYARWSEPGGVMQSGSTSAVALKALNERLIQAERALTSPQGLVNRPWYTHLLYAPGFYTGYGVKTMPGIREAIEQGSWKDADGEIARVAAALNAEATIVSQAAAALGGGR
jgi:N-acetylated-alpha-linked acidic dipeptidase